MGVTAYSSVAEPSPGARRVAAVDLGTNSTRLLVADVAGTDVHEVERQLVITRLGEGVDARRRLLPLPIARVRNALTEFRRTADALGVERTLAVATSAVRDAENGEAFLGEVEWSYGWETRLLSGEEEAELTFRGVTAGRASVESGTAVLDVGGGSTEIVVGGLAGIVFSASLDLGCVRGTESFLQGDPPTAAELESLAAGARTALVAGIPFDVARSVRTLVGVAGTITTTAALDLGLGAYDPERVHGHVLTAGAVEHVLVRLAALPQDERRRVPALEPERAPVILAGLVIAREAMRHLGVDHLEASERDLLHGIALDAAELPEPEEGAAPPGAYTCC